MKILKPFQRDLLYAVGQSELRRPVYFTGGTLLACHYLQHRQSFDLDFFSDDLLDDLFVAAQIKAIAAKAKVSRVQYVRFPNRSQYFMTRGREEIKFELAFFPFPRLGRRIRLAPFDLMADSLRDIAVNKTHACFERDAPRDAFDLYLIMKKTGWNLGVLLRDVRRKFGTEIDLVNLVARLLAAVDRMDEVRPLLVGHTLESAMVIRDFFEAEAKRFLRRKLPA